MILYRATEHDISSTRVHPWDVALYNPKCRYVDFRKEPELIEITLEDYRPWSSEAAIQRFYELLRWLNGPESNFERMTAPLRSKTILISTALSKSKPQED